MVVAPLRYVPEENLGRVILNYPTIRVIDGSIVSRRVMIEEGLSDCGMYMYSK
jgi:hypothetical protein